MHGSCDQPGGWGWAPPTGRGIAVGRSDSPVQVELFPEALTPGVLRDRGQAGKLVLEGDPAQGQRPGPGCRPGGAGHRRVPRGSRLPVPRGRRTGSRHPCCGTSRTGPAIPRSGQPRPGEPGQVPAFRFDVAPCALNARAADQPRPAVHTPPSNLVAITILALHASGSPGTLLTRAGRTPRSWRPR